MIWFWIFQIAFDLVVAFLIWKVLSGRWHQHEEIALREAQDAVNRQDIEQYYEAMSQLCDRLQSEGERWSEQLENRTRMARQVAAQLEKPTNEKKASPACNVPDALDMLDSVAAQQNPRADLQPAPLQSASLQSPSRGVQREVCALFDRGDSVEKIARQLQLGAAGGTPAVEFAGKEIVEVRYKTWSGVFRLVKR